MSKLWNAVRESGKSMRERALATDDETAMHGVDEGFFNEYDKKHRSLLVEVKGTTISRMPTEEVDSNIPISSAKRRMQNLPSELHDKVEWLHPFHSDMAPKIKAQKVDIGEHTHPYFHNKMLNLVSSRSPAGLTRTTDEVCGVKRLNESLKKFDGKVHVDRASFQGFSEHDKASDDDMSIFSDLKCNDQSFLKDQNISDTSSAFNDLMGRALTFKLEPTVNSTNACFECDHQMAFVRVKDVSPEPETDVKMDVLVREPLAKLAYRQLWDSCGRLPWVIDFSYHEDGSENVLTFGWRYEMQKVIKKMDELQKALTENDQTNAQKLQKELWQMVQHRVGDPFVVGGVVDQIIDHPQWFPYGPPLSVPDNNTSLPLGSNFEYSFCRRGVFFDPGLMESRRKTYRVMETSIIDATKEIMYTLDVKHGKGPAVDDHLVFVKNKELSNYPDLERPEDQVVTDVSADSKGCHVIRIKYTTLPTGVTTHVYDLGSHDVSTWTENFLFMMPVESNQYLKHDRPKPAPMHGLGLSNSSALPANLDQVLRYPNGADAYSSIYESFVASAREEYSNQGDFTSIPRWILVNPHLFLLPNTKNFAPAICNPSLGVKEYKSDEHGYNLYRKDHSLKEYKFFHGLPHDPGSHDYGGNVRLVSGGSGYSGNEVPEATNLNFYADEGQTVVPALGDKLVTKVFMNTEPISMCPEAIVVSYEDGQLMRFEMFPRMPTVSVRFVEVMKYEVSSSSYLNDGGGNMFQNKSYLENCINFALAQCDPGTGLLRTLKTLVDADVRNLIEIVERGPVFSFKINLSGELDFDKYVIPEYGPVFLNFENASGENLWERSSFAFSRDDGKVPSVNIKSPDRNAEIALLPDSVKWEVGSSRFADRYFRNYEIKQELKKVKTNDKRLSLTASLSASMDGTAIEVIEGVTPSMFFSRQHVRAALHMQSQRQASQTPTSNFAKQVAALKDNFSDPIRDFRDSTGSFTLKWRPQDMLGCETALDDTESIPASNVSSLLWMMGTDLVRAVRAAKPPADTVTIEEGYFAKYNTFNLSIKNPRLVLAKTARFSAHDDVVVVPHNTLSPLSIFSRAVIIDNLPMGVVWPSDFWKKGSSLRSLEGQIATSGLDASRWPFQEKGVPTLCFGAAFEVDLTASKTSVLTSDVFVDKSDDTSLNAARLGEFITAEIMLSRGGSKLDDAAFSPFLADNFLSNASSRQELQLLVPKLNTTRYTLFGDPGMKLVQTPLLFATGADRMAIAHSTAPYRSKNSFLIGKCRMKANGSAAFKLPVITNVNYNAAKVGSSTGAVWSTTDYIKLYDDDTSEFVGYAQNAFSPFVVGPFDFDCSGGFKQFPEYMLTTLVDMYTGRLCDASWLNRKRGVYDKTALVYGFRHESDRGGKQVGGQAVVKNFTNLLYEREFATWERAFASATDAKRQEGSLKLYDNAPVMRRMRNQCIICVRDMQDRLTDDNPIAAGVDTLYSNVTPSLFFSNIGDFSNQQKVVPTAVMMETKPYFEYAPIPPQNRIVFSGYGRTLLDNDTHTYMENASVPPNSLIVMGQPTVCKDWIKPAYGFRLLQRNPDTDRWMPPHDDIKAMKARWLPYRYTKGAKAGRTNIELNEPDSYGDLELVWDLCGTTVNATSNTVSFSSPFRDDHLELYMFKNIDSSYEAADYIQKVKNLGHALECDILFLESEFESPAHIGSLVDRNTMAQSSNWQQRRVRPVVYKKSGISAEYEETEPGGDTPGVYPYEVLAGALIFKVDGSTFRFYKNQIPGATTPELPSGRVEHSEVAFVPDDFTRAYAKNKLVDRDSRLQRPVQYITVHKLTEDCELYGNPKYTPSSLIPSKETPILLHGTNEFKMNVLKRLPMCRTEQAAFQSGTPVNFQYSVLKRTGVDRPPGWISVNTRRPAFTEREMATQQPVRVLPTRELNGYNTKSQIEFTVFESGTFNVSDILVPHVEHAPVDLHPVNACWSENCELMKKTYGDDIHNMGANAIIGSNAKVERERGTGYNTLYVSTYQNTSYLFSCQDSATGEQRAYDVVPNGLQFPVRTKATNDAIVNKMSASVKAFTAHPYEIDVSSVHTNDWYKMLDVHNLDKFQVYPRSTDSFSIGNTYLQAHALGVCDATIGLPMRRAAAGILPGATIEYMDGNQYCAGLGAIYGVDPDGTVKGLGVAFVTRRWIPWENVFGRGSSDALVFQRGRVLHIGRQRFEIVAAIAPDLLKVRFDPAVHTVVKTEHKECEWGVSLNAPTRQLYDARFEPSVNVIKEVYHPNFTTVKNCQIVIESLPQAQPAMAGRPDPLKFWEKTAPDTYLMIRVPPDFNLQTFYQQEMLDTHTFTPPHPRGSIVNIVTDTQQVIELVVCGEQDLSAGFFVGDTPTEQEKKVRQLLANRDGSISIPDALKGKGFFRDANDLSIEYKYPTIAKDYLICKAPHGRLLRGLKDIDGQSVTCQFVFDLVGGKEQLSGGSNVDTIRTEGMLVGTCFGKDFDAAQVDQFGGVDADRVVLKDAAAVALGPEGKQCGVTKLTLRDRFTKSPPMHNIVFKITNPCSEELVRLEGGTVSFFNFEYDSAVFATNAVFVTTNGSQAPPAIPWFPDLSVSVLNSEGKGFCINHKPNAMLNEMAFRHSYLPEFDSIATEYSMNSLVEYKGSPQSTNFISVIRLRTDDDGSLILGRPRWSGPDQPIPWTSSNLIFFDGKLYTNSRPMSTFDQINTTVFDIMSADNNAFHTPDIYNQPRHDALGVPQDIFAKKPTAYQYSLVLPAAMVTNMLLIAPTGTGKSIMTYLICKMYYDHRAANDIDRMITFIVKDKTVAQMCSELFEQCTWTDIAQPVLTEMLSVHHTNTKDEIDEMTTLTRDWNHYSETNPNITQKAQRTRIPCNSQPPGMSSVPYYTDVVQLETIHVVSMSELQHLHRLSTKLRRDQQYRRSVKGHPEMSVQEDVQKIFRLMMMEGYFCIDEVHEIVQNWDTNRWIRELLDTRRAQLRRNPELDTRFVGLTATTASNRQELIEMLSLSAVAGRSLPCFNDISFTSDMDMTGGCRAQASKRPHLSEMRRAPGTPEAWKLKPFLKARTVKVAYDMYYNFCIQPLKFVSADPARRAYDSRSLNMNIRNAQDVYKRSYINPEFAVTSDGDARLRHTPPQLSMQDLVPAYKDVASKMPWSKSEKEDMLAMVERQDPAWKMPCIVAHDRGKGYLEDLRLYKGSDENVSYSCSMVPLNRSDNSTVHMYVPPQLRFENSRSAFVRLRGTSMEPQPLDGDRFNIFNEMCDSDKGCASRVQEGWHINDQGAFVCNPDAVYDPVTYEKTRTNRVLAQRVVNGVTLEAFDFGSGDPRPRWLEDEGSADADVQYPVSSGTPMNMAAPYQYAIKHALHSGRYYQSELYILVKVQQKSGDSYTTKDMFVFKNQLKNPKVTLLKGEGSIGGWQPGSVFSQMDVANKTFVKVKVGEFSGADKNDASYTTKVKQLQNSSLFEYSDITIVKMKGKDRLDSQLEYSLRKADRSLMRTSIMLLQQMGNGMYDMNIPVSHRPTLNTVPTLEGNVEASKTTPGVLCSFAGVVHSVDECVGGRVVLLCRTKDDKQVHLSFANFQDKESLGSVSNPFWNFNDNTATSGAMSLYRPNDPVLPPNWRPSASSFYTDIPLSELPLRIVTSEPYFTCWRDVRYKLKTIAPPADPDRTDDVSYSFDAMYEPSAQRFQRHDFEKTTAHMLRYIEDVDMANFGNDDRQAEVMAHYTNHPQDYIHLVADGDDDELFIDTAYAHYIPRQQTAPIVRWTSQTRIRVDYTREPGSFRFFYNDVGGTYLNEAMKDTTQKELRDKIAARLNTLTSTNDELLKTISELQYKGCSDFTGSTNLEEWDPSYFPRATNHDQRYERGQKITEFARSIRTLTCLSYFSMSLMDNDQYAKLTYANNTTDPNVRRLYGGCEQTTKIIIMRLKNSLAEEVQRVQFGTGEGPSSALTPGDEAVRAQLQIAGSPIGDTHSLLLDVHFRLRNKTGIASSADVFKVHEYIVSRVAALRTRLEAAMKKKSLNRALKYDEAILLQLEEQQQVSTLCSIYEAPIVGTAKPTAGYLTTFVRSFNGYMAASATDDRMTRAYSSENSLGTDILIVPMTNRSSGAMQATPSGMACYPLFCWSQEQSDADSERAGNSSDSTRTKQARHSLWKNFTNFANQHGINTEREILTGSTSERALWRSINPSLNAKLPRDLRGALTNHLPSRPDEQLYLVRREDGKMAIARPGLQFPNMLTGEGVCASRGVFATAQKLRFQRPDIALDPSNIIDLKDVLTWGRITLSAPFEKTPDLSVPRYFVKSADKDNWNNNIRLCVGDESVSWEQVVSAMTSYEQYYFESDNLVTPIDLQGVQWMPQNIPREELFNKLERLLQEKGAKESQNRISIIDHIEEMRRERYNAIMRLNKLYKKWTNYQSDLSAAFLSIRVSDNVLRDPRPLQNNSLMTEKWDFHSASDRRKITTLTQDDMLHMRDDFTSNMYSMDKLPNGTIDQPLACTGHLYGFHSNKTTDVNDKQGCYKYDAYGVLSKTYEWKLNSRLLVADAERPDVPALSWNVLVDKEGTDEFPFGTTEDHAPRYPAFGSDALRIVHDTEPLLLNPNAKFGATELFPFHYTHEDSAPDFLFAGSIDDYKDMVEFMTQLTLFQDPSITFVTTLALSQIPGQSDSFVVDAIVEQNDGSKTLLRKEQVLLLTLQTDAAQNGFYTVEDIVPGNTAVLKRQLGVDKNPSLMKRFTMDVSPLPKIEAFADLIILKESQDSNGNDVIEAHKKINRLTGADVISRRFYDDHCKPIFGNPPRWVGTAPELDQRDTALSSKDIDLSLQFGDRRHELFVTRSRPSKGSMPNTLPVLADRFVGMPYDSTAVFGVRGSVRLTAPDIATTPLHLREMTTPPPDRAHAIILYEFDWSTDIHNGNGRGGVEIDAGILGAEPATRGNFLPKQVSAASTLETGFALSENFAYNSEHISENCMIWTNQDGAQQLTERYNLTSGYNASNMDQGTIGSQQYGEKGIQAAKSKLKLGNALTSNECGRSSACELKSDSVYRAGEIVPNACTQANYMTNNTAKNLDIVKRNIAAYRSTQAMAKSRIAKNQLVVLRCPDTVTEDTPMYVIRESSLGDIREARHACVSRVDVKDPLQWSSAYDREAHVGGYYKQGFGQPTDHSWDGNQWVSTPNWSEQQSLHNLALGGKHAMGKLHSDLACANKHQADVIGWTRGLRPETFYGTETADTKKHVLGRHNTFERMMPLLNPDGSFGLPYPSLSTDLRNLNYGARGLKWRRVSKSSDSVLWEAAHNSTNTPIGVECTLYQSTRKFDGTGPNKVHVKKLKELIERNRMELTPEQYKESELQALATPALSSNELIFEHQYIDDDEVVEELRSHVGKNIKVKVTFSDNATPPVSFGKTFTMKVINADKPRGVVLANVFGNPLGAWHLGTDIVSGVMDEVKDNQGNPLVKTEDYFQRVKDSTNITCMSHLYPDKHYYQRPGRLIAFNDGNYSEQRPNPNLFRLPVDMKEPSEIQEYYILDGVAQHRDQELAVDKMQFFKPSDNADTASVATGFHTHKDSSSVTQEDLHWKHAIFDPEVERLYKDASGNTSYQTHFRLTWPDKNPAIKSWDKYNNNEKRDIVNNICDFGFVSKVFCNNRGTSFDAARMYCVDSRATTADMSDEQTMLYGTESAPIKVGSMGMASAEIDSIARSVEDAKDPTQQLPPWYLLPPPFHDPSSAWNTADIVQENDGVFSYRMTDTTTAQNTNNTETRNNPLSDQTRRHIIGNGVSWDDTKAKYFFSWDPRLAPTKVALSSLIPVVSPTDDVLQDWVDSVYKPGANSWLKWMAMHNRKLSDDALSFKGVASTDFGPQAAQIVARTAGNWKDSASTYAEFAREWKKHLLKLSEAAGAVSTHGPRTPYSYEPSTLASLYEHCDEESFSTLRDRTGGINNFHRNSLRSDTNFRLTEDHEATLQLARLVEFETKLAQMQLAASAQGSSKSGENTTNKAADIFTLLMPGLYKEIHEIVSSVATPQKTTIYVKALAEAKLLTEHIREQVFVFAEKSVARNPPRVWITADGRLSVDQHTKFKPCMWPYTWHNDAFRKNETTKRLFHAEKRSCVNRFKEAASVEDLGFLDDSVISQDTGAGGWGDWNGDNIDDATVRRVIGRRGEYILIELKERGDTGNTVFVRIPNPLKRMFATKTFADGIYLPDPFKDRKPHASYPRPFQHYAEPIFIGTSKEVDAEQPAFIKRNIGCTLQFQRIVSAFETLNENNVHLRHLVRVDADFARRECKDKPIVMLEVRDEDKPKPYGKKRVTIAGTKIAMDETSLKTDAVPPVFCNAAVQQQTKLKDIGIVNLLGKDTLLASIVNGTVFPEYTREASGPISSNTVLCLPDHAYDPNTREIVFRLGSYQLFCNAMGGNFALSSPRPDVKTDRVENLTSLNTPETCPDATTPNMPQWVDLDSAREILKPGEQLSKRLHIIAVQEQIGGMVFVTEDPSDVGSMFAFPNPRSHSRMRQGALERFNGMRGSNKLDYGCQTGLLVCDMDSMKSSLDFRGVRVMIKFGFMTYLTSKQVDGRTRRLGVHSMLPKEERSVTQYLIIPYHEQYATCLQQYQRLICRQTEFFQTLDDMLLQCSLSKTAVDAYGHEDKLSTKIKEYTKSKSA